MGLLKANEWGSRGAKLSRKRVDEGRERIREEKDHKVSTRQWDDGGEIMGGTWRKIMQNLWKGRGIMEAYVRKI